MLGAQHLPFAFECLPLKRQRELLVAHQAVKVCNVSHRVERVDILAAQHPPLGLWHLHGHGQR